MTTPVANSSECDICSDVNGIVVCSGGSPTVVPYPITPGVYDPVITVSPNGVPNIEFAIRSVSVQKKE